MTQSLNKPIWDERKHLRKCLSNVNYVSVSQHLKAQYIALERFHC